MRFLAHAVFCQQILCPAGLFWIAHAVIGVETAQDFHVLFTQRKIEQGEIARDMGGIGRLKLSQFAVLYRNIK